MILANIYIKQLCSIYVLVPKAPIVEAKFELNNPSFLGPYFTLKCFLRNDNDTLEIFNIDFAPKKPENGIKWYFLQILMKFDAAHHLANIYCNILEFKIVSLYKLA